MDEDDTPFLDPEDEFHFLTLEESLHETPDANPEITHSVITSQQKITGMANATATDAKLREDGLIQRLIKWILDMIQTDFNFLISCGTVFSSFLTQIIPIHTMMTIRCNKSTGNLKTINFVSAAFANFLWSLYGIISNSTVLMLSSIPGFLLSCCYIAIFHKYCQDGKQMRILQISYKFAIFSCLFLVLTYLSIDKEVYFKFIGLFGASIQGVSYITPILSIKEIMKNRSTSAMPTEISLANFVGAFFTLCYGFIIWDYIVIAPNFIGMASGMIQVIILVLVTNNDKIVVKEVDILEKQHFKPTLKSEFEI